MAERRASADLSAKSWAPRPAGGAASGAGPRELALAAFGFLVLTLALTWPAVAQLARLIPVSAPAVDALCEYYALGWGLKALATQPLHYFDAPYFYPYAGALAYMEHLFGLALLALPVKLFTGSLTAGYNVVWLLTFVLSALGAYQLTRTLTGSRAGALLAGVIYGFHPFRYHNAAQLNVLAMMWIPWALLALQLWLARGERRHLVALALLGWWQFVSSAYAAVFLVLAAAILLLLALRRDPALVIRRLVAARGTLVFLLFLVGAASAPFVRPYTQVGKGEARVHRVVQEAVHYSAHPVDFLTAAPGSLWRGVLGGGGAAHHALFPGVVALLLAGVGLWRAERIHRFFYGGLMIAGALLALGPRLLDVPARIPLPFLVAWYAVPGASFIRAPVRFITLSSLGLAVLAGFGVAALARRGGAWRALAFVPAALAALELSAAPVATLDPLGGGAPAVYALVKRTLPATAILAELPMPRNEHDETIDDARYPIYALETGLRTVNGVAAFLPPRTRTLRRAVQGFPDSTSMAALRAIGVTHIIVHSGRLPEAQCAPLRQAAATWPGLHLLEDSGGDWLFRLDSARAAAAPGLRH